MKSIGPVDLRALIFGALLGALGACSADVAAPVPDPPCNGWDGGQTSCPCQGGALGLRTCALLRDGGSQLECRCP